VLEVQGDHAGLEVAVADVGESVAQVEHAAVVGEHVGSEAVDATRLARLEKVTQEEDAKAAALVSVLDHEGDFGDAGIVRGLVACHGLDLRSTRRAALRHERQAAPVVDAGEHCRPVGRQALHDVEEAW
jgi:hypothetical protein